MKQEEACEGSLERTREKPTFILRTELQVWKEPTQEMPGLRKLSGAALGALGWERRQHLKKQGVNENGHAALVV